MGSEGFVVVAVGIGLGLLTVKLFPMTKWGKNLIKSRSPREKVLNNPDLLVKKLKEGAGFVDDGMEMDYSVVEKDGKKVVALDMKKEKQQPKAVKKMAKKVVKKQAKKKVVKKKVSKKVGKKNV